MGLLLAVLLLDRVYHFMMYTLAHVLSGLLSLPVLLAWKLAGWELVGRLPDRDKMIVLGAPHTSNWDYIVFIGFAAHVRRRVSYFIKAEALRGLLGTLMRWGGGVGIDRSRSHNFVEQAAEAMRRADRMLYALTPEGTRKYTDHWKSGFYHIAVDVNVPIVPIAVNYAQKRLYIGEGFLPCGDIEVDMDRIRAFYDEFGHARYPEKASAVRVRSETVEESIPA